MNCATSVILVWDIKIARADVFDPSVIIKRLEPKFGNKSRWEHVGEIWAPDNLHPNTLSLFQSLASVGKKARGAGIEVGAPDKNSQEETDFRLTGS